MSESDVPQKDEKQPKPKSRYFRLALGVLKNMFVADNAKLYSSINKPKSKKIWNTSFKKRTSRSKRKFHRLKK